LSLNVQDEKEEDLVLSRASVESDSYRIGIDVGGTFTDVVLIRRDGTIETSKVLSTPPEFSEGILLGLSTIAKSVKMDLRTLLSKTETILGLGTTVAENAVFTGSGAQVALITTRGFEDTLIMTRGALGRWSGLTETEIKHVIANEKPKPLVPKSRIKGIVERTDSSGKVLIEADEENISQAVRRVLSEGSESFAVCLLWSFLNFRNEEKVRDVINELAPNAFVTLSSELAPFLGEYERTSTTVLNAYVGPISNKYLASLRNKLRDSGFAGDLLIMQGYGGLLPTREASGRTIGLIESGPAAGIRSCEFIGRALGITNILACDMGGTTFKVGMITNGEIEYSHEANIGGYNYVIPKMDITSIGAGGGSLVTVDPETKVPRVGPKSAEAIPGPVCYDLGGKIPTVTDVDLIIGLMDPSYFLGGKMKINKTLALEQFKSLVAEPLGLNTPEAASSIYRITNAQLADLIHKVTVERGLDPRDYILFSYGGAASIHTCSVCDELGITRMLVPYAAPVNGALGAASSDVIYECVTTHPLAQPFDSSELNEIFDELKQKAYAQLHRDGFKDNSIEIERSVDMRYKLQTHEVTTPIPRADKMSLTNEDVRNLIYRFEALYEQKYGEGSAYKQAGVEMITFRLKATGKLEKYVSEVEKTKTEMSTSGSYQAFIGTRRAYFERVGFTSATFYDFTKLKSGNKITGPAVILAPTTTIVVNPSWIATFDALRNILLTKQVN
jgi:N-methylhydantoinase A